MDFTQSDPPQLVKCLDNIFSEGLEQGACGTVKDLYFGCEGKEDNKECQYVSSS